MTNDRDRVHVFLFGTRLSNVTRQLKARDPEVAFQMIAQLYPTGPVARASARPSPASTAFGRSECWAKAPWCC